MSARPSTPRRFPAWQLLVCVAAVGITAACSPSQEPAPAEPTTAETAAAPTTEAPTPSEPAEPAQESSAPAAQEVRLTIKDFEFVVPETVPAGATITVVNDDSMAHTVTSASAAGAFDVTIAGGETKTFTAPDKPGSYEFVCTFHGNMKGTLVVT